MMRIVVAAMAVLAFAVPAAADTAAADTAAAPLMGLDWELLAGGGGNTLFIRESWSDPTSYPVAKSWDGHQYSSVFAVRFAGWGRRAGIEAGASAEMGQARFTGLFCWRFPVGGVEPYAGAGIHYIAEHAVASLRSGGITAEELDLAAAVGARFKLDRRPFLFVDCRFLGGGNFVTDWPQDAWHKQNTVQFTGGFGIRL